MWPAVSLAEIGEINTGSTPKTSVTEYWNGEMPFVTPSELGAAEPITFAPRRVTDAGAKISRVAPKDSVLVCCIGSLGKTGIAGRPLVANQQINWINFDKSRVWPRYGYYACDRLGRTLEKSSASTTIPIVNKSKFAELQIPLPPLNEQRRIATILDKADTLRRKRKRAIELLEGLTQSIFLKMFGDPIDDQKYSTRRLNDLVDSDRGISYGIVQRGEDREIGTKVLRISDIVDGHITGYGLKQTAPEIADKFRRTKLAGGEIAISIRGTVGRCAIVPSFLSGANVSREIAVIPTTVGRLNPFYLSLIRTDSAQRRLARDVKGVAQSGINLEDLRELPIIQPPKSEIDHFLKAHSHFQNIELKSREQSEKFEFLYSSLEIRAFSGQL